MQINVFHRHDLCVPTAGGTALHPKDRAQRWFTQADHRALADRPQAIAKTNTGCRFAFTRWGRTDRGHQDQLGIWINRERIEIVERDLGLVAAVGFDKFIRYPKARGDFGDALHGCCLGDVDICGHLLPLD